MKAVCAVLAGVSLCLVLGCNAVYSTKPVGETVIPVKAEDWEGTWFNKDGTVRLAIHDAEQGILQLAWIEKMKLESYQVRLLGAGDWLFANIRETGETERYLWARIVRDGEQINLWVPAVEKIRVLVEKGRLPGTVEDSGTLILGDLTTDHLRLITSEAEGVLFEWDKPIVLLRLTR
ncbi:MAG: hypothetical protein JXQ27_10445 [Acidobacteria bacterium]|nr:hypothetical protein [Acidobacteriota bacterium]